MTGKHQTWAVGIAVALAWSTAHAVPPLPEDKRIPARVVAVLSTENPTLHMPTDVAVASKGDIYIADGARDRIVTFSADHKLRSATTRPADRQLKRPVGVSVDAKDNLWVADTANHRVLVIAPDAKLVEELTLPKSDSGREADPTDIVVTPDGRRVYVVDNPNHRVLVRDTRAGTWEVLGKAGQAIGQFQYPFMGAIGNEGDLLIAEAIGCRVQVLTREHRWAGSIGTWGIELGQFHRPKGIATDKAGLIYVSDSTMNVVQVFDPRGRVRGVLTDAQGRPFYFKHPMGLTFDAQGRLYVVELAANRVAVVSLGPPKGGP
jgi:DNA-binding beta-propeller fold protein YncE